VTTSLRSPMSLLWQRTDDETSLQVEASIKQGRSVIVQHDREDEVAAVGENRIVVFENHLDSAVVYNRTHDHVVNVLTSLGNESFKIGQGSSSSLASVEAAPCYSRHLESDGGAVTENIGEDSCFWSSGVYPCGSSLCGEFSDFAKDVTTVFGPGQLVASARRQEQEDSWVHLEASALWSADLPIRSSPLRGWMQGDLDQLISAKPGHLRGTGA